jgi:uncharacterized protein (DUF1800 family)
MSSPFLDDRRRAHHFLNRFSLGPTPALLKEVTEIGPEKWLDKQLEGRALPDRRLTRKLVKLGSYALTNREVMDEYVLPTPDNLSQEERRRRQQLRNVPARELRDTVLLQAVYGEDQVKEVACDFFRNHFAVATDVGRVRYYATEYEREVIRNRVFGSFGDMLSASAKHPAMLDYLDNAVSRRPPTKAELKQVELRVRQQTRSKEQAEQASDIAAQRGLNENYARELLELHTLGVDNYYTQADVESVARILTGWTIENDGTKPLGFRFSDNMHAGGNKKVLRKTIKENSKQPLAEGEELLDMLVKHKGTSEFIAWKLCRHLVNDSPDEKMVARVAMVFRKSKGDLRKVYLAIATDEEFYAPRNIRAKFKRPFEFVVSALRATDAEIDDCSRIHTALGAMNEQLYLCKDPTGYYDQAEAWLDPGAFAVRWKFSRDLLQGKIDGVKVSPAIYDELNDSEPATWNGLLLERFLPSGAAGETRAALGKTLREYIQLGYNSHVEELAPALISIILGSPDFQKQ